MVSQQDDKLASLQGSIYRSCPNSVLLNVHSLDQEGILAEERIDYSHRTSASHGLIRRLNAEVRRLWEASLSQNNG